MKNRRTSVALVLAISAGVLAGCGKEDLPPPPDTYGVTGQVIYRDGQPLKGGIIQFIPQSDPALNMSSIIADDGSFELVTIHSNQNLAGAIEGPCEVLVTLPIVGGETPEVIVLREPYEIDSQENHFVIQLNRPAG